jgi:hypothetical protein
MWHCVTCLQVSLVSGCNLLQYVALVELDEENMALKKYIIG